MWIQHNGMLEVWTLFMKKVGTKLKFNTTFHPQIDAQTKRVNKILNKYLHNYIVGKHKD